MEENILKFINNNKKHIDIRRILQANITDKDNAIDVLFSFKIDALNIPPLNYKDVDVETDVKKEILTFFNTTIFKNINIPSSTEGAEAKVTITNTRIFKTQTGYECNGYCIVSSPYVVTFNFSYKQNNDVENELPVDLTIMGDYYIDLTDSYLFGILQPASPEEEEKIHKFRLMFLENYAPELLTIYDRIKNKNFDKEKEVISSLYNKCKYLLL